MVIVDATNYIEASYLKDVAQDHCRKNKADYFDNFMIGLRQPD